MKIPAFNVQGMMPRFLAHFTPPPFAFSLLHGLGEVWRYTSLGNTKQRESGNGEVSISLLYSPITPTLFRLFSSPAIERHRTLLREKCAPHTQ